MDIKTPLVIETLNLCKTYKNVNALCSLNLQVPQHSIFGFLKPNGAGKTTTIKLLLGLARPTSGSGKVFGHDIVKDCVKIRRRVGYLAQEPRYYEYMTARETLRFTANFFFKGPRRKVEERIAETLDLVNLSEKADRPIKSFSGGEKQRLGIAQAQVNYPDLLILDEPAASLDPQGRHDVLDVMERLRKYTTIFYSTHILDDVQRVSDTVCILNKGMLIALLRQQLIVLNRQVKRPQLTRTDRFRLVLLARFTKFWKQALHIVQPDTLLRWHQDLFRLYWRLKSKRKNNQPKIPPETIDLIRKMANENWLWGAERIRGELLKLGIKVCKRTIQKYMPKVRKSPSSSQTWATFLKNHAGDIWACDFTVVYDWLFRPWHIFVLMELKTRRIVHTAVTQSPTDDWTAQQLREATPWGQGPKYLIRDRDSKYASHFSAVATGSGINVLKTPYRAPRACRPRRYRRDSISLEGVSN
jgi:ABC-type multidrug transport system ATPase subunit